MEAAVRIATRGRNIYRQGESEPDPAHSAYEYDQRLIG
jgi:hypothetical protein